VDKACIFYFSILIFSKNLKKQKEGKIMFEYEVAKRFFEQEIFGVLFERQSQLQISEEIREEDIYYVIGIMLRYLKSDNFCQDFTVTPLFDLADKKVKKLSLLELQRLGDFCLFRAGFFPFGFSHRHNPPRKNFILAGQSAYHDLSRKLAASSAVFRSLAFNFQVFVNAISEIKLKGAQDHDILQLFDFWQETGNLLAAEILSRKGVCLNFSQKPN